MDNASGAEPRQDLGQALMEFETKVDTFVANQIFTPTGVSKESGKLFVVTRESIAREVNAKVGKTGGYNRDAFEIDDVDYACEEFGLEDSLRDKDRNRYATVLDAEQTSIEVLYRKLMLDRELRAATVLFNTSTWTGSSLYTDNSGSAWATVGTGVIGHIDAAKDKVRGLTGLTPDTLIVGKALEKSLKINTEIEDAIRYTGRLTQDTVLQALADIFGIKRVIFAGAVKNSAAKGKTFTSSDVWGETYAMVCVTAGNAAPQTPGVGRLVRWDEDTGVDIVVEQYRDNTVRSTVNRVRCNEQTLVVDASFAHLMKIKA